MSDIKLYNGDCLEIMKEIPDKSIDMVLCDLPYFKVVKDKFDNIWDNESQYLAFIKEVCDEYYRIVKPNGNIFYLQVDS